MVVSAYWWWKDTAAFTPARPGLFAPCNFYWCDDLHVGDMPGFLVDSVVLYRASNIIESLLRQSQPSLSQSLAVDHAPNPRF